MTRPPNRHADVVGHDQPAGSSSVESLIEQLASPDRIERQNARFQLESIGREAVPELIAALSSRNEHVRWEAAKTLSSMEEPSAGPALVKALSDDSFGIRWLVANGLIVRGVEGLKPLLNAVASQAGNVRLREGAHHVLRFILRTNSHLEDTLLPVVNALESPDPDLEVPIPAWNALRDLAKGESNGGKNPGPAGHQDRRK